MTDNSKPDPQSQDVVIENISDQPNTSCDVATENTDGDVHVKTQDKVTKCCYSESCLDFTQNTTLHGLRYIWLPGAKLLRR